tara:strand:+ start:659 stop:1804 length:1146 start_codon:yes stop_codon:yes gene_type:complete
MSDLEFKAALGDMHKNIEAQMQVISEKSEQKGAEYKAALDNLDGSIKSLNDQIIELAQKHSVPVAVIEKKSFGGLVMDSDAVKSFIGGNTSRAKIEVKNTILNSGNDTSRHDQLPGVVPGAVRQLTVMPTVAKGSTSSNIIYYSKELLWTNNAVKTAEGVTKPESVLTFEEASKAVVTIPHFIKVSKQALADSTFLSSYIDSRLRHGVNNKVEQYVISDASDGWLAAANSTVVSPLLTVDVFGLASKMKYAVIAADYEPSFFYMNPADWGAAEVTRRASSDNAFVAASGAVAYVNNGLTPLLWGLPVVLSNNVPAGTMICKSMDADMFADRESTTVEMFEQDSDNVTKNLVTIRAEARGAELVFTPAAILTGDITSITSPA